MAWRWRIIILSRCFSSQKPNTNNGIIMPAIVCLAWLQCPALQCQCQCGQYHSGIVLKKYTYSHLCGKPIMRFVRRRGQAIRCSSGLQRTGSLPVVVGMLASIKARANVTTRVLASRWPVCGWLGGWPTCPCRPSRGTAFSPSSSDSLSIGTFCCITLIIIKIILS